MNNIVEKRFVRNNDGTHKMIVVLCVDSVELKVVFPRIRRNSDETTTVLSTTQESMSATVFYEGNRRVLVGAAASKAYELFANVSDIAFGFPCASARVRMPWEEKQTVYEKLNRKQLSVLKRSDVFERKHHV